MNYKTINDNELLSMVKDTDEIYGFMYNKYIPLINKIITKYKNTLIFYNLELEDVNEECLLTLIETMKSYDSNYDNLFYTYLLKSLKYKLLMLIRDKSCLKRFYKSVSLNEIEPNTKLKYEEILEDRNINFYKNNKNIENYINKINDFETLNIIKLRIEGYNLEEISILLNIEFTKVKTLLYSIKNIKME